VTKPLLDTLPIRSALALLIALAALLPAHAPPAVAESVRRDGDASYVLLAQGSRGATMSGSMDDLDRAKALRAGSEGLLYVRQGGAAYVIRDAAVLRRAKAIFEPQEILGARQADLGRRQAALGKRQAQLGMAQAQLGLQQAGASSTRAAELERQQDSLGRQQDALGQQQDVLGRQQDELGGEQGRLAVRAKAQLRALVADAVQRGMAQRVD
jgi:hypothetical protein